MKNSKLYRGEYGDSAPLSTRLGSLTFTDNMEEALRYAQNSAGLGRLLTARIAMVKPWINKGVGGWLELGEAEERLGRAEAIRIAVKFSEYICDTNNWEELAVNSGIYNVHEFIEADETHLAKLYFRAFRFFDCPEEVSKLKAAGYDCAIMPLMPEFKGGLEYRVFDASSITVLSTVPVKESK